jgi:hypothetical protein
MADLVLLFHSYFRWFVLFLFFDSLLFLFISLKNKNFSKLFKLLHKITSIAMSIQFVIGIILYSVSPIVASALEDMGKAMKDKELRFFSVEHTVTMFLALGLFHASNAKIKKDEIPFENKYKFIVFSYAILIVFFSIGIPWFRPFLR